MLNEKQIKERIYELKKEIGILYYIINGNNDNNLGRPRGSIQYTQEQMNFLKECEQNNLDDKEIINLFNLKFGTDFKEDSRALYNLMNREGIKKNIIRK